MPDILRGRRSPEGVPNTDTGEPHEPFHIPGNSGDIERTRKNRMRRARRGNGTGQRGVDHLAHEPVTVVAAPPGVPDGSDHLHGTVGALLLRRRELHGLGATEAARETGGEKSEGENVRTDRHGAGIGVNQKRR